MEFTKCQVVGEHSGLNIAAVLLAVIKEYGFQDFVGYFVGDNAESNDVAVDAVLRVLYPKWSAKMRKQRRLRCFGHITNLCAQAFIIGKDAEKVCKQIDTATREMDFKKVHELWKKQGAVGLLQNLIRYIRLSPQRRQFFKNIVIGGDLGQFDGLELLQCNQTRWNSLFVCIGRALNVRERVERFCNNYTPPPRSKSKALTDAEKLKIHHWTELEHLHTHLETFYEATLMVEGRNSTPADHFFTLDWLMGELDQMQDEFDTLASDHCGEPSQQTYEHLSGASVSAWAKCEKYFKLADEAPAYYAAIVLNPTLKLRWFEEKWGQDPKKRDWIGLVEGLVKELWQEYKGKTFDNNCSTAVPKTSQVDRTHKKKSLLREPTKNFASHSLRKLLHQRLIDSPTTYRQTFMSLKTLMTLNQLHTGMSATPASQTSPGLPLIFWLRLQ